MSAKTISCGSRCLTLGVKTFVMGVVNVTPDSFSDGGRFFDPKRAIDHGLSQIADGADVIDIGGFATSTYSHARVIDEDEEIKRVIPVIRELVRLGITNISIDTMRANVASRALDAGASWINDQSAGLKDQNMPFVMAKAQGIVVMHDGGGETSGVYAGEHVVYDDVIGHIRRFFLQRIEALARAGVDPDKIIIDPGIGFGKGLSDSLTIVNNMHRFYGLGAMSLLGLSRKSFIGKMTGITTPSDRDFASLGAHAAAIVSGVTMLRTHNVRATVDMAKVLDRCLREKMGNSTNENLYQTRR